MKLKFTMPKEDVKNVRRIIFSEYSFIQRNLTNVVSFFRKTNTRENNITVEFDKDGMIQKNTRFADGTMNISWRDIKKVTCKEGYIFISTRILKLLYICNEDYFKSEKEKNNFINFLNERIGKDEVLDKVKNENTISYKKVYSSKNKYINEILNEEKFIETSNFMLRMICILTICTAIAVLFLKNINITMILMICTLLTLIFMAISTKGQGKRNIKMKLKSTQENFERNIILEKDKNCIIIESPIEIKKININNFLGIYTNMLVFKNKDKYEVFRLKSINKESLEEMAIIDFLEENKETSQENNNLFKNVQTRVKLQILLLLNVIATMGMAVFALTLT